MSFSINLYVLSSFHCNVIKPFPFLFHCSPSNLSVSAAAESLLQLQHRRRCVLSPRPPESAPAHTPHQRELLLRRGVQLLPTAAAAAGAAFALPGAIDTATDATAAAAVSAGDALQPQLSAAVAPPAASRLRALLCHLHAAAHAEHGQCRHVDLLGGLRLAQPCPQPGAGIDTTGAQDAPAAEPV